MSADVTEQRVVVADDDVLLREGVAGLLERAGFDIAGQAGDATELLRVVRDQQPNLAIVDIRMPPKHETEGLDAARVIRRELPEVAILVLSAHAEVAEAMELLAMGRVGVAVMTAARPGGNVTSSLTERVKRCSKGVARAVQLLICHLSAGRLPSPAAAPTFVPSTARGQPS